MLRDAIDSVRRERLQTNVSSKRTQDSQHASDARLASCDKEIEECTEEIAALEKQIKELERQRMRERASFEKEIRDNQEKLWDVEHALNRTAVLGGSGSSSRGGGTAKAVDEQRPGTKKVLHQRQGF